MSATAALNPTTYLRTRFHAWLERRLPRHDTVRLTQSNIYILPTPAGLMFGLTLLVLLVASVNYRLNLGYVLTFLLAGSGAVSIHLTHATLRGLTLHLKPVGSVFAGEPAVLDVVITTPGSARFGIGVKIASAAEATLAWTDIPAGGQATAQVTYLSSRRGRHDVPPLTAETRFPLGLFRAWTVWRPAARILVYPASERDAPRLPAARSAGGGTSQRQFLEGGEIEGVRAYRRGDPLQRVAWKKAAQALEAGGELVSRDTAASASSQLWLEWAACQGLAPEARLSRLTAWTVAADRTGAVYGLRLPGTELEPRSGDAQRHRVLEALGLWT